ncbi:TIGR00341 family protein [Thalassobacillus pellis]|uniref:TIGR00341 family protein n=1 Tax=Thalassobacillus pellis TaxID=748008 RepID=UPI0019608C79|nr:TIGR00341 family protein [Thalassobacillus pellis]MBM7551193.1 putative hydrophobic protein (TIGR00341 family) [Thalassobacillus pellis]
MEFKVIDVYIPSQKSGEVFEKLQEFEQQSSWMTEEKEGRTRVRIIVSNHEVEDILNYLEGLTHEQETETLLVPVDAYFSKDTLDKKKAEEEGEEGDGEDSRLLRASRHELLTAIEDNSTITLNYTIMIVVSAIVATVGFLKNSEAVVIAAMVIAPLIGPVIAIAFASILGDYRRIGKAITVFLLGFFLVLGISVLFGYVYGVEIKTEQYLARTEVTIPDIFLGIASGVAGALAFLNHFPGNLVGIMVAIALLPPTVALGISLGDGVWSHAYGSILLVLLNMSSILLSAMIIFSLSGIRPVKWAEVQKANVSRPISIVFILILLSILAFTIVFGNGIEAT